LQCEPQEGVRPIQEYRVNKRIKAKEVRLIDQEGEQIGIVSRKDALEKADEANLDLVEVAPDASPPVCRLLDYGKFRYQQQKKEKQSQQRTQVKEVRIGLTT
jgi:translation initiation factor IF-3